MLVMFQDHIDGPSFIGPSVPSPSKDCSSRKGVSTRYPGQFKRKTIKDFFCRPPFHTNLIGHLPDEVKHISADTAEKYRFNDAVSLGEIGPREFHAMLLQSGASASHVTKDSEFLHLRWVSNHYKWIVWKLASLERCYPAQASGKYLTVSNVLEELKYRYEREVNYGHRSAIKKILDGDASAASAVVLCISSILFYSDSHNCKTDEIAEPRDIQKLGGPDAPESYHAAKIELSDGWYALDAQLDTSLLKQLIDRKLFVGQKLRIVGAHLCGWVAPVSPLEAHRTVSLLLSINGTYRAHWADHLGFCKGIGPPLAFSCIKSAGGKVPRTLVGITRRYPVLYKERLPDGGSIVRSERMEKEVLRLYDQRRSSIVEDVVSKHQDFTVNGDDSEEGAKIFKILQTAAEPEVLMADMTSEQLSSFTEYQAKHEANRQSEIHKKIEKALENAGLGAREVTPFMRVRVVGLTSKGSSKKARPKEGLIAIWNPTEKQQDLVEGQIYCVGGLMPLHSGSDVIYLQSRGSSTLWELLAPKEHEKFEPFFTPRKPVSLSNLGDVPLASEFDIAAVVVHVGEVCLSGRQKKQWVFMTDGSCGGSDSEFEGPYSCLLAVNFCGPIFNNDSSSLVSHNLSGTVVGFFNLVKRARDQMNHLWVAETSENSSYSVYNSLSTTSHLNKTGECAQKWAKASCSTIQKLRERVFHIIQGH
ncbi:putative breast cancer type 2 susceptibility protein [Dioscorea sansibarensis]